MIAEETCVIWWLNHAMVKRQTRVTSSLFLLFCLFSFESDVRLTLSEAVNIMRTKVHSVDITFHLTPRLDLEPWRLFFLLEKR
jgi:hypothetical protein